MSEADGSGEGEPMGWCVMVLTPPHSAGDKWRTAWNMYR